MVVKLIIFVLKCIKNRKPASLTVCYIYLVNLIYLPNSYYNSEKSKNW